MTLEKNLSCIEVYDKGLANKIRNHDISSAPIQLLNADSGDVNLIYNGIPVHSTQNPQQEAILEFNTLNSTAKNQVIIIFGLGLGYLFKRLFISTSSKIIIYEPDMDILRFTLEAVDFSSELSDERVRVTNTLSELIEAMGDLYFYKNTVSFKGLPSVHHLYPKELEEFKKEINNIIEMQQGNYVTIFANSYLWLYNGLHNTKNFINNHNVDVLRNVFKDKPAIIVSPGPSIDQTIDKIKENENKAVIFAVNHAYRVLKEAGITPDFVVFTDGYELPAKMLEKDGVQNTNLIAQSVVSPIVFNIKGFNNKFVFYSKNDIVSRFVSKTIGFSLEGYENKGTVSYCALNSAYMMGCNPIIMTGQDLAITNNKFYSSAAEFGKADEPVPEDYSELFKARINELKNEELIEVKGQNGEIVKTKKDYASFIKYFEDFANKFGSNTTLINCSPGGAQINGFINADISEILQPFSEFSKEEIIKKAVENADNLVFYNSEKLFDEYKRLAKVLEQHLPVIQEGLAISEKLKKELRVHNKNIQKIGKLINQELEVYKVLDSNIFSEFHIMLSACWRELSDIGVILEDESKPINLDTFKEISDIMHAIFSLSYDRFRATIDIIKNM